MHVLLASCYDDPRNRVLIAPGDIPSKDRVSGFLVLLPSSFFIALDQPRTSLEINAVSWSTSVLYNVHSVHLSVPIDKEITLSVSHQRCFPCLVWKMVVLAVGRIPVHHLICCFFIPGWSKRLGFRSNLWYGVLLLHSALM